MYTGEAGGEASPDEPSLLLSGRSGLTSTSNAMCMSLERDVGLPVVHIRVRPTLPYLGETKEQRRVWCVDQQNMFVQSNKILLDHYRGASPCRISGSSTTLSMSPNITSFRRLSASPAKGRELAQHKQKTGAYTPRERPRSVSRCCGTNASFSSLTRAMQKPAGSATPDIVLNSRAYINGKEEHFVFDFVHNENATQEEVFEESVLDFMERALLAQNVTIVCYGPTGSGKTYSMMGSAPVQSNKKQREILPVRENTPSLERSQQLSASKERGRFGSFLEASLSSHGGSSPIVVTPMTDLPVAVATAAKASVDSEQDEQLGKCLSPLRGNGATEPSPCSWSSGMSQCEVESLSVVDVTGGVRQDMNLAGICSAPARRQILPEGEDTMGMLPRIVLILLERRGVPVVIDREEAPGRGIFTNRGGNENEKAQEKPKGRYSQTMSLTLQELVFYGVELYMDEFRDLLDPAKRSIPNVGDIGVLDAFCQKMNNLTASTTRSNGGGGSTGKKTGGNGCNSVPIRGGGVSVSSVDDFRRCYELASRNRVTKGHQRNNTSSRSHAMFILQLQFDLTDSSEAGNGAPAQTFYSYVAMVDLAGSERVKETKVEGHALREAQYINKSLSALSAVILALHQRSSHVPYRDSKLTRLLRPCLEAGHVLTLVHVPPCSSEEAISSLKFAEQVRYTNVQKHNSLSANNEVIALFQNLKDPDAAERLEAYHRVEVEYAQLCAEIRLAYFIRDTQDATQPGSLVCSINSSGRTSLCQDFSHSQRREYVIRSLVNREVLSYVILEQKRLLEETAEIEQGWKLYVEDTQRRIKQDIETTRLAIDKLQARNAQLAEENNQPVLRDAHAMTMRQWLKELSEDVTNCAKERLLLLEGMRAVRQRLAMRDDLESCLDDELKETRVKSSVNGGNDTRMSIDGNEDLEMGEIYHQQLLLSREMSLLRDESTCFVKGDEVWERLWARVMRQELLLLLNIDMEMMEGILLCPQSLSWALKKNGLVPDAIKDIVCPFSSTVVNVKKLLDTFETVQKHPTEGLYGCYESDAKSFHFSAIPLALSNGDEVKRTNTLIGCYSDEAKLQEVSVKKLFEEGIYCEVTCLSIDVNEFMTLQSSMEEAMEQSDYKFQWGCLRLVHSPKDTSSYCLEFSQRAYASSDKVRDRRTISIPLSEPQLCIKLHVVETEGVIQTSTWDDESTTAAVPLPFIALELRSVCPSIVSTGANTQEQTKGREGARLRGSTRCSMLRHNEGNGTSNCNGLISGATENAVVSNIVLSKRLDCGGELLLPSGCMTSFEKGSGCILFQFPERLVASSTRTEAVECIVAALSGLTLPLFPSTSKQLSFEDEEFDAILDNLCVATYQHVPYVLLSNQSDLLYGGTTADALFLRGVGMPLLDYTSAMLVRFYFQKDNVDSVSVLDSNISHSTRSLDNHRVMFLGTACSMLSRLGAVTLSSVGIHGGGRNQGDVDGNRAVATEDVDNTELLLWRIHQLHTFRKKTRARVRQQIFNAEDIKAELLYSFSDSELMRGSYINEVLREARELIDLQQSQVSDTSSLRGLVHATPGLCRELCGAMVPWTVWQWAHWWKALQETYKQHQSLDGLYSLGNDVDVDIDDDDDGDDMYNSVDRHGGVFFMKSTSAMMKETIGQAFVMFEEVPCFLSSMEQY